MFRFLCDDSSAAEIQISSAVEERLLKILLCDDVDIVYDMRCQNGNPGCTRSDVFWSEMERYFNEITCAAQDRRHGNELYLPFAISVEDLVLIIASRVPEGSAIPSNEWVRLQFWPKDPTTARALHHTGRFAIKFAKTRKIRGGSHDDVWFCQYHFAVRWKYSACMLCLDDKAIIPIEEPARPVSATARQHDHCLAPLDGVAVVALDHDFHVCWIIPSVVFKPEIPNSPSDTFFTGDVHVVLKDKIFHPSNAFRHGTEITRLVRL